MITVYWSPWYLDHSAYVENYLAHYDPEKVYVDLVKQKENRNISDNYFNCHAFKNFCKNLYSLKNPYTVDFFYEGGRAHSKNPPKVGYDLAMTSQVKQPSIQNCLTINYSVNWIFFADKSVNLQTLQPWMHKTEASKTSFYVPGTFDISKWFRPIEMACQLFPGESTFKSLEGEPLIYANFLTDEPVVLKKFYLTKELIDMSISCTHLKHFKKFKSLSNLYKIFNSSLLRKKILKEIQKNIIED